MMLGLIIALTLASGIVLGAWLVFASVAWDYRTMQRAARRRAVFGAASREVQRDAP